MALPSEMLRRMMAGDAASGRELGRWLDSVGAGERPSTLAAYTADDESATYGAATVAELNALRAAYENLRAMTEDLRSKLIAAGVVR